MLIRVSVSEANASIIYQWLNIEVKVDGIPPPTLRAIDLLATPVLEVEKKEETRQTSVQKKESFNRKPFITFHFTTHQIITVSQIADYDSRQSGLYLKKVVIKKLNMFSTSWKAR